jgi:hypothetical protein
MTCPETCAALLETLETRTRIVEGLRAIALADKWRSELLEQADRERQDALDAWRSHLKQPVDLQIEAVGGHATLRYGAVLRVLPLSALTTGRGAGFVAAMLWDAAHPKPNVAQYAEAWGAARSDALAGLALAIPEHAARLQRPAGASD